MTADTAQIADSLEPLTLHSFEGFCEDIASMFGNAAECAPVSAGQGPVAGLKTEFKKLASVNQVQTLGILNGTFQLLLDQAGLFVLAGVFVMLPEKRILETIRTGTLKDADYINDAIKEVGNLLVGSWDRIFREQLQGHKHLKQTGTFVGSLWDNPQQSIGLNPDQPCRHVICRMKVDNFPEFKCAAVFSESLFQPAAEFAQTQQVESAAPAELQSKTEPTPQPAEPPAEPAAQNTDTPETEPVPPAAAAENTAAENDRSEQTASDPLPEIADLKTEPVQTVETQSTEQKPGPVAQAIRQLTQQNEPSISAVSQTGIAELLPGLTAGQIIKQTALWVGPEDTVEDVLHHMQHHNVSYTLVGADGKIEGLLSRSDMAAAVSPYTRSVFAHWRRPLDYATLQIRVKWFMSRPVHTIRTDASLIAVIDTMMRYAVRGLPVVDADGRAVGILTVYDIFAALLSGAGIGIAGIPQQAPPGVK